MAKDAYSEIAFDSTGSGFCKLYSTKLGMPTRDMVFDVLGKGIAEGSKMTLDGAPCHSLLVRRPSLEYDWCNFVPADKEYEDKMKLMSNCCSCLRHSFESHCGIKFSKLEAYANFFLYRWAHIRKHGLKILYLLWFQESLELQKATITTIHSEKHRRGFDFVPTFAPISRKIRNRSIVGVNVQ